VEIKITRITALSIAYGSKGVSDPRFDLKMATTIGKRLEEAHKVMNEYFIQFFADYVWCTGLTHLVGNFFSSSSWCVRGADSTAVQC
jgi:hypothetical protein